MDELGEEYWGWTERIKQNLIKLKTEDNPAQQAVEARSKNCREPGGSRADRK